MDGGADCTNPSCKFNLQEAEVFDIQEMTMREFLAANEKWKESLWDKSA